MSSSRKRAYQHKALVEIDYLKQQLALKTYHYNSMVGINEAFAKRLSGEPIAWKDTRTTIDECGIETREPVLLGYVGWESLPDGTELYKR